jgi:hypothetical protein
MRLKNWDKGEVHRGLKQKLARSMIGKQYYEHYIFFITAIVILIGWLLIGLHAFYLRQ